MEGKGDACEHARPFPVGGQQLWSGIWHQLHDTDWTVDCFSVLMGIGVKHYRLEVLAQPLTAQYARARVRARPPRSPVSDA